MPSSEAPAAINSLEYWGCNSSAIKNFFLLDEYRCEQEYFREQPLDVKFGFAVVLAFGLAFGLLTVALVYIDQYFFRRTLNSEYFNTAGRSVKTGLTAAVIVSQWSWTASLLQSTNVAYKYGISGTFMESFMGSSQK